MIATRTGGVIVYVHTADAPSDVEWDLAMGYFEAADLKHLRVLVYTDGAAPNASQRARLNGLLGSNKLPMAVLTPLSALASSPTGYDAANSRAAARLPRSHDHPATTQPMARSRR